MTDTQTKHMNNKKHKWTPPWNSMSHSDIHIMSANQAINNTNSHLNNRCALERSWDVHGPR